jgi:hypothetical protein
MNSSARHGRYLSITSHPFVSLFYVTNLCSSTHEDAYRQSLAYEVNDALQTVYVQGHKHITILRNEVSTMTLRYCHLFTITGGTLTARTLGRLQTGPLRGPEKRGTLPLFEALNHNKKNVLF